jgi:predicted MFS family arabinose efflux permease
MIRSSLSLYRHAYAGLSRSIWWLSLVMFVNRSGTMVVPFLTVYLTVKLHFSIAEAGLIMAFFGGGSVLGALLGGRLSDRIGFHAVQYWSLLLNGMLFIVLGQMKTFEQIAACIFILSTVGESFRPANGAAIAAYSDESNRTRSYSLNRLAVNLGFSIGPAVGGILSSFSYQWLFWVDGFTCMLAAVILRTCLPPLVVTKKAQEERKIKLSDSVYRDHAYLRFMFFVFLVAFCFLHLFSLVPVYYKEQVHMPESMIGLVLGMNGLIIALTEMVLVYKLEGKRSSSHYIAAGAGVIGVSYLVLTMNATIGVAILAMIMVTVGEMLMFPFVNSYWVSKSKEHNRGQYAAVYTITFSLAQIAAPTVGSQVIRYMGFHSLWYILCGICLIASICFYTSKT